MKVYDKSAWQIDAGVNKGTVAEHFKLLFSWLNSKGLLNEEGIEVYELNSFSDTSLHEGLLSKEGNVFIGKFYDKLLEEIQYGNKEVVDYLNDRYINR